MFRFIILFLILFLFILASKELIPNPTKSYLTSSQNQTPKAIKQEPIESERIQRAATPDAGKQINI